MIGDRYSNDNPLAAFGMMINALGGGGDRGQSFPASDAEDFSRGVSFVPGEVTIARRAGHKVHFHAHCQTSRTCWYWEMPNGERIYHFDKAAFEDIRGNHSGVCPSCGNSHIGGGTMKA